MLERLKGRKRPKQRCEIERILHRRMIITFTQNKDLLMKFHMVISTLILSVFLVSCAHYPPDRYNTQAGAVTGAGMGALIGQAIGGNTQGTLIGLAAERLAPWSAMQSIRIIRQPEPQPSMANLSFIMIKKDMPLKPFPRDRTTPIADKCGNGFGKTER